MSGIAWRRVLLAICALAALAQAADVLDATGMGGAPPWEGWWGAGTGASSKPFNLVVTSVDRGGPAARAGLRRGDLIDIRANTLVERYSFSACRSTADLSAFRCVRVRCKKNLRSDRRRQNFRGTSGLPRSRRFGFCCSQR